MDKIVSKIAALGVPSLVIITAMEATGYVGAAAITASLAALGPGGILGGILFLGVTGLITEAVTEYGMEVIFRSVVKELYRRGESRFTLSKKIDRYPISKNLKLKLNEKLWEI